jgi:hypothetical protein
LIFITRQLPVISWATILFTCYYSRKLSVNCICRTVAISSCCVVLNLYAELFPQHQLVPQWEHIVSIMKTLSSAFVCVSQSTQSASTIINIDSVVCLSKWYRSTVYREILEWWFFHGFFTFRIGYCCILFNTALKCKGIYTG